MSRDSAQNYSDSKLYLQSVTTESDKQKCYRFLWTVNNYKKINFGIEYTCHCIRIGEENCYLKLKRNDDKYAAAKDDKKKLAVRLELNLSPFSLDFKCNFKLKNYSENYNNDSLEERPLFTPNGRLEVNCEITLFSSRSNGVFPDLYLPLLETEQTCKVYNYLDEMFSAGLFSDLSIHVNKKIFNIHKVILATRSKVFETMLKANMRERLENKIIISDGDSEIFGKFLRYVYSNKLNLSSVKSAIGLYELSEKYGLPDLKLDTSKFLGRNLSSYNVLRIKQLADLHRDITLKEATLDYMSRNILEVMKSPEWLIFRAGTGDVDELLLIVGNLVSEDRFFEDFRPKKY